MFQALQIYFNRFGRTNIQSVYLPSVYLVDLKRLRNSDSIVNHCQSLEFSLAQSHFKLSKHWKTNNLFFGLEISHLKDEVGSSQLDQSVSFVVLSSNYISSMHQGLTVSYKLICLYNCPLFQA